MKQLFLTHFFLQDMCAKTFRALQCSKLEINAVECTMCSTPLQSGAARSAAMSFAQQCAIYVQRCASLAKVRHCASLSSPGSSRMCHLLLTVGFHCLCWQCCLIIAYVGVGYWLLPLSAMLSNRFLCWCWLLVIASVGNAV